MSWLELAYSVGLSVAALGVTIAFGYCAILLHNMRSMATIPSEPEPWTYGDIMRALLFYAGVSALTTLALAILAPERVPPHAQQITGLITMTFVHVVMCLYILMMAEIGRGKRPADMGLSAQGLLPNIGKGILVYVCFCPIFILAPFVVRKVAIHFGAALPPQPLVVLLETEESTALLSATALLAVVAAPVVEEMIFRGFLFSAIRDNLGSRGAVLLSALAFSLVHGNWFAILPLFLLGMILAWSFEWSKSLTVPITIHMVQNAVTIFTLLYNRITADQAEPALGTTWDSGVVHFMGCWAAMFGG